MMHATQGTSEHQVCFISDMCKLTSRSKIQQKQRKKLKVRTKVGLRAIICVLVAETKKEATQLLLLERKL